MQADHDHSFKSRDLVYPLEETYVTCLRYLSDSKILVAYSNGAIAFWDVSLGTISVELGGHDGAVTSLALSSIYRSAAVARKREKKRTFTEISTHHPNYNSRSDEMDLVFDQRKEMSWFVSGGVDKSVRVWDLRMPNKPALTAFSSHKGQINCVESFVDPCCFGSASDDGSIRLFDIRTFRTLNMFQTKYPVTSVSFSSTGQFVFGGLDDYTCRVWDTISGEELQSLSGHEGKVSCTGVPENGGALCTASWDTTIRIWA